ncbi:MAG: DUF4248 domain-containing protein [Tannerellaceae bacterium]
MENFEQPFRIRAYAFTELAQLYFIGSTSLMATKALGCWVHSTLGLRDALLAAGWRPYMKILPPKVVECFVDHLGAP